VIGEAGDALRLERRITRLTSDDEVVRNAEGGGVAGMGGDDGSTSLAVRRDRLPKERTMRARDLGRAPEALVSPSDTVMSRDRSGEDVRERLPLRRALNPEKRRREGAIDEAGESHGEVSSRMRIPTGVGVCTVGEEMKEDTGVSGGADSTDEPVMLPLSLSLLCLRSGQDDVLNETRRWRRMSGLVRIGSGMWCGRGVATAAMGRGGVDRSTAALRGAGSRVLMTYRTHIVRRI
jgi:hypothetical protein